MPIFKLIMSGLALLGAGRAFGVSWRDARTSVKQKGGVWAAFKADAETFWNDSTEPLRGWSKNKEL